MSIIDKMSIKNNQGTPVEYDIGASATNVSYDNNTSIKNKIDDMDINLSVVNGKINITYTQETNGGS